MNFLHLFSTTLILISILRLYKAKLQFLWPNQFTLFHEPNRLTKNKITLIFRQRTMLMGTRRCDWTVHWRYTDGKTKNRRRLLFDNFADKYNVLVIKCLGSALCWWANLPFQRKTAFSLGAELNCPTFNSQVKRWEWKIVVFNSYSLQIMLFLEYRQRVGWQSYSWRYNSVPVFKCIPKKSFCVETLNFRTLHPGWSFFQTPPVAGA